MSLDCSKLVSQLNSVKESQKQLTTEIAVFESIDNLNIKTAERIRQLSIVYKSRQELHNSLNEIAVEILAERLDLETQYNSRVNTLKEARIIHTLYGAEENGFFENGVVYPTPAYDDILRLLRNPEKRRIIEKKADQGFTKFILVPFAKHLSVIFDRYVDVLRKNEGNIKSISGTPLELANEISSPGGNLLDPGANVNAPREKQLEYFVKDFNGKTKQERGGKYKDELLIDPNNAWQFLFLEDELNTSVNEDKKSTVKRNEFESGLSIVEYFDLLRTDLQYQNEQGLTPEALFTLWLTYLSENQTIIDYLQNNYKAKYMAVCLSGAVPYGLWDSFSAAPFFSQTDPNGRGRNCTFRTAVDLKTIN
jgi:hypothetical protein